MGTAVKNQSEVGRLADEIYARVRRVVETPENIGKMMIIDVDSGEFEIDEEGFESSDKLKARHPNGRRFGIRVGYRAAESFGGMRERIADRCLVP
jgi:hypothetical protein